MQIRNAIEHIFKVGVDGGSYARYVGKRRRIGRHVGTTGNWKKAIVRVKEGHTIDFY